MRVLLWHVDARWTTAFVQGGHDYYVPVTPDRGPDGLGRDSASRWPGNVHEVEPVAMRHLDIDVVVLQRPHEPALAERWLGRCPGRDVPAVYVEHHTPGGDRPQTRHPMADQRAVAVVHVTDLNDLVWDCGSAPTAVVEHGILDPGYRYTGDLPRAAVVHDPTGRGRQVRAELVSRLVEAVPVDLFGPGATAPPGNGVTTFGHVLRHDLYRMLPRRRVYVHTARWTSFGPAPIEAMLLGMPVVVVGAPEAAFAVPSQAGVVTTDREHLVDAVCAMIANRDWAVSAGLVAREHALEHHGLERFLDDWDVLLADAR